MSKAGSGAKDVSLIEARSQYFFKKGIINKDPEPVHSHPGTFEQITTSQHGMFPFPASLFQIVYRYGRGYTYV